MAFGGRVRVSRATAAQLTVAFFVAAAAVGLPLAWSRAARLRAAEKRESGAAREAAAAAAAAAADEAPDAATRLSERLAVELLVNERRAARGEPQVDYVARDAGAEAEALALFARLAALHKQQRLREAAEAQSPAAAAAALQQQPLLSQPLPPALPAAAVAEAACH